MSNHLGASIMPAALHAASIDEHLSEERDLASSGTQLTMETLEFARTVAPVAAEANTLAAWLCARRAGEQLRVAFMAAYLGHYSEVPLLIRGAYESSGLSRKLALEAESAERWLKEGTWHRDSQVRNWIRERGGDSEASRDFYKHASDAAHVTYASTYLDSGREGVGLGI